MPSYRLGASALRALLGVELLGVGGEVHRQAAVDGDRDAGDEAGGVGREERDELGDVFRLARPRYELVPGQDGHVLLGDVRPDARGQDHAWGDRDRADSLLAVLRGDVAGGARGPPPPSSLNWGGEVAL